MNKKNILLLFGGESSEHDVSISSARNVYAAMDNTKYHIELGYIDRQGKWWLLDAWPDNLTQHGGVQLAAVPGAQGFMTIPGSKVIHPDVVFPVLHGKNGEDGTLQGMLQLMHVPFVGCGVEASAVCMDKTLTKQIAQHHNIPVVPWLTFTQNDDIEQLFGDETAMTTQFEATLGQADNWFVKPSRAGSSVGVSKVTSYADFVPAITEALKHDDMVLVERGIMGRELEVAVLGTPPHHQASGVGEILPGDSFYSYEDKYAADSSSEVIVDAELPDDVKNRIRQYATQIYALVGCQGLSRVDFLLGEDMAIYLNEVNTLPGFTNISMYPKLWREAGVSYAELIDRLIADAYPAQ